MVVGNQIQVRRNVRIVDFIKERSTEFRRRRDRADRRSGRRILVHVERIFADRDGYGRCIGCRYVVGGGVGELVRANESQFWSVSKGAVGSEA